MRILVFACLVLGACAPAAPVPVGVGFGDYVDYAGQRAAREAQLSGAPVMSGPYYPGDTAIVATTQAPAASEPGSGETAGLSDEQSFTAVSGRESIESDAQRLARQRAAYQVVQPTAVPTRPAASGTNIVAYALATTNRRGEPLYRRSGSSASRAARACARFTAPDLAQEAFLVAGGPERDPKGLDPDGDGFACAWDPAPFRTVRR